MIIMIVNAEGEIVKYTDMCSFVSAHWNDVKKAENEIRKITNRTLNNIKNEMEKAQQKRTELIKQRDNITDCIKALNSDITGMEQVIHDMEAKIASS